MWRCDVQWEVESDIKNSLCAKLKTSNTSSDEESLNAVQEKIKKAKHHIQQHNLEIREIEKQRHQQELEQMKTKSKDPLRRQKVKDYNRLLWDICSKKEVENDKQKLARKIQARKCFDHHRRKEIITKAHQEVSLKIEKESKKISLQADVLRNRLGPLIPKRRHCHSKNKCSYRGSQILPWEMNEIAYSRCR